MLFVILFMIAGSVLAQEDMMELPVNYPAPSMRSQGPRDLSIVMRSRLDPLKPKRPIDPVLVPRDIQKVSEKCPVSSSDIEPIIGELAMVTDGVKDDDSGSFMELGPGTQWVQVDLKTEREVWAIALWHFYSEPRIYRDVIVQVADDAAFKTNIRTLFNNDHDDTSGRGKGSDFEYIEDHRGLVIPAKGIKARFVRCWSRGNTSNDLNHYVEVEVWGR